jgi:hypothetical protein
VGRRPVDIGTPGSGGLWLERPTGRESSSQAERAGNPALRASRHGHVLAEHDHPKPPQTLSKSATDDIALTQAWPLLPEETKDAFGNLFSRMAMRLLRSIPTFKVEL